MTLPALRPPRKLDPEELIREIEEDPLSQFTWNLLSRTAQAACKVRELVSRNVSSSLEEEDCCPAACCESVTR